MDSILLWILSLIGGGGIGAAITYLITLKSRKSIAESEATTALIKAEHEKLDFKQDKYDYLLETLDKYIKDYHELEQYFRDKMYELRQTMDNLTKENSKVISDKCSEIAALKAKVTYLNGIRCYEFTCPKRIKTNPDKQE